MTDPRVANRLAHFRNMRCTIKVKFLINGNPFYSGRLLVSYRPLPRVDDIAVLDGTARAQLINASQQPHVMLDPTTSQGGVIHCPFIFPKNAIEIPLSEWSKMGRITISTLNNLQHANGGTDPLTVSVFAYSEDMNISTPTSRTPEVIIPQGDEYGVVSGPAHTISNWSGKLANAPFIGKFARATSLVSSAVGGVAQLFGFSRPRMLDRTGTFRVTGSSLASTNIQDMCDTLALDSKKEVTIDPTVVGCEPQDEMALIPLACRESYLQTFRWELSDTPDEHLFSIRVGPMQGQNVAGLYHMTPSAWVASPFQYWTGSMQIRLQAVASAYHRGRIRVLWDPDFYSDSNRTEFNLNYSQILDLAENRDFTIKVGWGQSTNYLEVGGLEDIDDNHSFIPYTSKSPCCNGVVSVYVVNELTAPTDDDRGVSFNVFTSMCDDFEINGPTDKIRDYEIVTTDVAPPAPVLREFITTALVPAVLFVSRETNTEAGDSQDAFSLAANNINAVADGGSNTIFMAIRDTSFRVASYGVFGAGSLFTFGFISDTNVSVELRLLNGASLETFSLVAGVRTVIQITAPVPEGYDETFFTLVMSSPTGRVGIDSVGTWVPLGARPTIVRAADVDTTAPLLVNGASVQYRESTSPITYNGIDAVQSYTVRGYVPLTLNGKQFGGTTESTADDLTRSFFYNASAGASGPTVELGEPINALSPFIARAGGIWYLEERATPQGDHMEAEAGESNVPEMEMVHMYMGPECVCGPTNQVYFGEQVASWRQVLRRYVTKYRLTRANTAPDTFAFNLPLYPDVSIGTAPVTGVTVENYDTLFDWVIPAYITVRGGMRVKIIDGFGNEVRQFHYSSLITRLPSSEAPRDTFSPNPEGSATFAGSSFEAVVLSGMHAVEFPFYSRYRFYPARSVTFRDPSNYVERDMFEVVEAARGTVSTQILYSTSEDFSLSFFLSTPVVRIP